mmetsp:Transcript_15263/g.45217  ORF Transcript_15263/g.45217 Transcript_15263/m.45217 type:complete len:207 (+) Transcript_15263:2733-3353(+)
MRSAPRIGSLFDAQSAVTRGLTSASYGRFAGTGGSPASPYPWRSGKRMAAMETGGRQDPKPPWPPRCSMRCKGSPSTAALLDVGGGDPRRHQAHKPPQVRRAVAVPPVRPGDAGGHQRNGRTSTQHPPKHTPSPSEESGPWTTRTRASSSQASGPARSAVLCRESPLASREKTTTLTLRRACWISTRWSAKLAKRRASLLALWADE